MGFEHHRVVITAAGRDFGRTLALRFAARGADVHLCARTLQAAERVREAVLAQGHDAGRVHAYACDLADPASVREFAAAVSARTDRVDVLLNHGSRYHHGPDLLSASDAHDAFHAATSAQAGSTEILSRRLREHGVRVISLYPPDFDDHDPLSPQWEGAPRTAKDPRTAQSPVDCIFFAVGRPRDCFIKSFHFEQV
ncbi:SDR family NAD(P)-dependent oxidoreductase [Streptomyces vinaceus]|uniref:SDR family NAD(P)-dependent oxidoreductase n=1 Tax=Streptomyces vinaceus TaxID=1960 RepID=A0A5J6JLX7_STRVI|nr:SDR family NAD(P)-dependent oxidoreductase [Streptomyces vinaceus]QEV48796.1 SDR family NAD(P)-dependent oxidoreductase [Streptomyces vinaceus]GHE37384.1 oxidoreductase [Streptomyces vinaceus]